MKKILAIVHQETSTTGLVGDVLSQQGFILDVRCPAMGHSLPVRLDDHDGVVIFGGPMSANDDATLPFIRAELEWIPIALAENKPFLGICLGAQLLARVLGAAVTPHPEGLREIGYAPIQPIPDCHNPFAALTHVYHWHKEGFELSSDSVLLAMGERFENQAFRYGERAYGVQFHPEITATMIEHWTDRGADQLQCPEAQSASEQLQQHDRYSQTVKTWLQGFLNQWAMAQTCAA